MARRLRVEPYDPNAVDGDGDGIVQENTAWERPVGTRLIDEFGDEIRQGLMSMQRPSRMRVVDASGNDVRYIPTYATQAERQVAQSVLGALGRPSLAETGAQPIPTLADRGIKPISERVADIDAIVNPQTITPPDVDELPLPTPGIFPKMEKSSPTAKVTDAYSPSHSGLPMLDTLMASADGYDTLKNNWETSGADYFEYETRTKLTFDDFVELVRVRYSSRNYSGLVDFSQVTLQTLERRIDETLIYSLESDIRIREITKDLVSTQIGSKMADIPMSASSIDASLGLASKGNSGPVFRQIGELESAKREFTDFFSFGFIGDESPGVNSMLSPEMLREYLGWGLGGERPLWLDSPDIDSEVKAIFSLPPTIFHPEGTISTKVPMFTIGAFMPITEFDSPEVVEAKTAVQSILSKYSASQDTFVGQQVFESLFKRYSVYRSTATDEISLDVAQYVFDHLDSKLSTPDQPWHDTKVGRSIELILDGRPKALDQAPFEERLMIFAASEYCDDEMRSIIIRQVGWDFTKQERWQEFVDSIKEDPLMSYGELAAFPELRIVNRNTMTDYVKRDGSSVVGFRDDLQLPLDREIGDLVYYARTRAEQNTDPDTWESMYEAVDALTEFIAKDKPDPSAPLAEKDEWVRELYEKFSATIPGYSDRTPLERSLDLLHKNSYTRPLSPEKAGLLIEQPTLDFHRYLASRYVSSWAESSNGDNPLSYLVQETVQKLFGIEDDDVVGFDEIFKPSQFGRGREAMLAEIDKLRSSEGDLVKAFVLSQYENTQEFYRSRGITSVPLSRGMTLPADHPYIQELLSQYEVWKDEVGDQSLFPPSIDASVLHRPLSSFATYLPATKMFSGSKAPNRAGQPPTEYGVVLLSQVPVHQIFGNPYTGNGCLNEYEAVVLGGGLNARVYLTYGLQEMGAFDLVDSRLWRQALARFEDTL